VPKIKLITTAQLFRTASVSHRSFENHDSTAIELGLEALAARFRIEARSLPGQHVGKEWIRE
jgi:hypothetical protein